MAASRWWNKALTDLWQFESHRLWLYFCDVRADSRSSAEPSKHKPARVGRWVICLAGFLTTHGANFRSKNLLAARP